MNNGLLPIVLTDGEVAELMRRREEVANYKVTVDLDSKSVSDEQGFRASFEISDFQRYCLLEGLDDIGLTLKNESDITAYERRRPAWMS